MAQNGRNSRRSSSMGTFKQSSTAGGSAITVATRQSTRTLTSKSSTRISQDLSWRSKKGRKKKKSGVIEQEDTIKDQISPYEEYEEDEPPYHWEFPKPREMPRLSVLIREWLEAQPEPADIQKMTKKQQKAYQKEMAETAAVAADGIKEDLVKEIQNEIRTERITMEAEIKFDEEAAVKRKIQLAETLALTCRNKKLFKEYAVSREAEDNWTRYLTCDGLPDPGCFTDMNTYLFVWKHEDCNASMNVTPKKLEIVISLLAKLDEILEHSLTRSPQFTKDCRLLRDRVRKTMQNSHDLASFHLLRHIETHMTREGLKTATYVSETEHMICCFWVLIKLPIGYKQAGEKDFSKSPIEVEFKEIQVTVRMPVDVTCYGMAIRGLLLKYDHYSDTSASYEPPVILPTFKLDMALGEYSEMEYREKRMIREDQMEGRRERLEEKKQIIERLQGPQMAPGKADKKGKKAQAGKGGKKIVEEEEKEPLPYLPTPDELLVLRDENLRMELRQHLFKRCKKVEVNLRKYRILGGVYHIDLIRQPPQPKDMRRDILLTTLELPKVAKYEQFLRTYTPPTPQPGQERTPEVIEEEMRALELAMEALVLITLKLPRSVLWFEPPCVAHWLPDLKIWTTEYVHDSKYNEEQQLITFRTGILGIHGLAARKFSHLPYQSWEMKPETGKTSGGGVLLSIVTASIQVEFIIREDTVCLNSMGGAPGSALEYILGKFMQLHDLIKTMQKAGCDLFPKRDAFAYVKHLSVKHPVAERHLQDCMGLLCNAYTFSWSRWNAGRPVRDIILLCKEMHGCVAKAKTNVMLLVSPARTTAITCTESSPEFNGTPEDTQFYSDLYHYARHNAGIKSQMLMKKVSFKLAETVTRCLVRTNVISMSG